MSESLRADRFLSSLLSIVLISLATSWIGCAEEENVAGTATAEAEASSSLEARSAESEPAPPSQAATPGETRASAARAREREPETAPRHPNERPIPAFEGRTIAGTRLAMRDLLGSRVLLFFFNPEIEQARPVAEAVGRVAALAGDHNFRVVGVGIGSSPEALSGFARSQDFSFPVLDDSGGEITNTLRLRAPIVILGVDPEGYMSFALGSFPEEGDVVATVETSLRERLRLPDADATRAGELYAYPAAPALGVIAMSNGEVLETAELAERAAVVIFFLHTCPHCHKALGALKTTLALIPEAQRPRLVAVSVANDSRGVRRALDELGLDYFDPYLDPSGEALDRWGVTGGVPVVLVLDAQGRIRHRSTGWDEKRDAAILRMKLAAVAGARVPMLLDPEGYSGNDVCGTCHEQEHATWQFTRHATAFDTLVTHAADRRTDCVGCHVVGFEEKGGYDFRRQPRHLEDVGCESCHGRGGPHLSPGFVPEEGYAQVCETCHNPTHSLGFDYETFHPRVSHEAIAAMPNEARVALAGGGGPGRDLLPTQAEYVGSDACQSCHAKEFETWQASPHGLALASLEEKGKSADAACLACHTTAYAKPGGFPAGGSASSHQDLARVGCESCHGPGGDHVGENARRVGTILSLGDKCDSCVILKICGTCHDDDNDPGFPFRVEERIEAQRHGTIESAASRDDASADRSRLHEAFERLAGVGTEPTSGAAASEPARAGDPS
ncbi:MAG: redoxin domain-containing protein [Deltaproteobacteria bacterium]|jgi:peroxiredoxin|nr:redoxin domain-containing protein [Deltaproteobacteria bacterium]